MDGQRVRLGSTKERALLAVLLCAAGAPVPVDALMERVWDGAPPPSGTETLQAYVSRLRNRLRSAVGERARLDFSARTYRLQVDPEAVDLLRFRQLHRQGRATARSGDAERAVAVLREAEALWRGEALTGVAGDWADGLRSRLDEERRAAQEHRVHLELELGQHAELVGELQELSIRDPVTESVVMDLMLALYRCGRLSEALAVYRDARIRLRDELGLDPSPHLEQLHQRLLRSDATLTDPAPLAEAPPLPHTPDSLPRDVPDFTGRRPELAVLTADAAADPAPLPVLVISGMPGCGKSTLAVHAAHQLRERYPGGLLHVDLHAHGHPTVREPAEALLLLLTLLGAQADLLPGDQDALASLWRERMARRRALLILDDARDAAQVRPLLPGTADCLVIVTSRYRLPDLEGARPLPLDVLSSAEAAELFTRVAGPGRTTAPAVHRVVDLCGRHPLAVRLAAGRFRYQVAWDVNDLADRLEQSSSTLGGIPELGPLSSSFDLSYAALGATESRLFRLLALHPGPDLTLGTAVALDGRELPDVRRDLERLIDCHVLEELLKDRYSFHELIRGFALRMGLREDDGPERTAAEERLLDHYLVLADQADRLAHPLRRRLDVRSIVPAESGIPVPFSDAEEADSWLDVERSNLLSLARSAAKGSPRHARLFPHVLAKCLFRWGAWQLAADLHRAALTAWGDEGDPTARGQVLVDLASIYLPLARHEEALRCAQEALTLSRGASDHRGQAEALYQVGRLRLASGRSEEALRCLDEALLLHRGAGNPRGEAEVRNTIGIAFAQAGKFRAGLEQFRTMLHLEQLVGDRHGQVWALNNMGEMYSELGLHEAAREYYGESLELVRRIGGRQELGNLYENLGNNLRATGEPLRSLTYHTMAVATYRDIGDLRSEGGLLISMGLTQQAINRPDEALEDFLAAERIAVLTNNQHNRQKALLGIAGALRTKADYAAALTADQQARQLSLQLGADFELAQALDGLARTSLALRREQAAVEFWEQALEIYRRLGVRQADEVCEQLLRLP